MEGGRACFVSLWQGRMCQPPPISDFSSTSTPQAPPRATTRMPCSAKRKPLVLQVSRLRTSLAEQT